MNLDRLKRQIFSYLQKLQIDNTCIKGTETDTEELQNTQKTIAHSESKL